MKILDIRLCILISILAFMVYSCSVKKGQKEKRPNIVVIMADDLTQRVLSSYGSDFNQTPNIDRLAQEGISFRNSFATPPLCAPSRAITLTGKRSYLNGVRRIGDVLDTSEVTYPKLLQKNGYQTALFGKWHLRSIPQGFNSWKTLIGLGEYYNPDIAKMNGDTVRYTGYVDDLITEFSLQWIKNRDRSKPFCLLVHYKSPHRTWMPDLPYLNKYDNKRIPMPKTFWDDYSTKPKAVRGAKIRIASKYLYLGYDLKIYQKGKYEPINPKNCCTSDWYNRMNKKQQKFWDNAYKPRSIAFHKSDLKGKALTMWKYENFMRDYLSTVAGLDHNAGRILDYLDKAGLKKNTIVIFTSDNGLFTGEHGWFNKRFMYKASLHVPLIVRFPNHIKAGRISNKYVLNLDLAPTILDYADVGIPKDMQGHSLQPLFENQNSKGWRKAIYVHYYGYPQRQNVHRYYGMLNQRYKLIHYYGEGIGAWELYDEKEDPYELKNIYHKKKYHDLVIRLRSHLQHLRNKFNDSTGPPIKDK